MDVQRCVYVHMGMTCKALDGGKRPLVVDLTQRRDVARRLPIDPTGGRKVFLRQSYTSVV
eukprot:52695-Eustigmatos_ZCMA.PRE.1